MMDKHSIGTKLFYVTLIIGFVVMSLVVLIRGQLAAGIAHERFDTSLAYQLESHTGTAAGALWVLDTQALEVLVKGIVTTPYISYAEVSDNTGLLISAGVKRESTIYERTRSLEQKLASSNVRIGTLRLQGDLDALHRDTWSWLYDDLPLEILGVAFVALFLYLYVKYTIIQRLKRDAERMSSFQLKSTEDPFVLPEESSHNELFILERSINSLAFRLRKSSQALIQSQKTSEANKQRYQDLFENSPVALWLFDIKDLFEYLRPLNINSSQADTEIFFTSHPEELFACANLFHPLHMNKATLDLFGARVPEDVINNKEPRYITESLKTLVTALAVLSSGIKKDTFETVLADLNGQPKYVSINWQVLANEENKLLVALVDITERKRAEEQIQANLAEKEVLIRELFHRTKNNMQSLIALISFEYWHIEDEGFKEVLHSLESRVYAMALAHRMLYEYKDLSRLSLTAYIRESCAYISANEDIEQRGILFDLQLEEIEVTVDIAMPMGLILTELISNSLKHGFEKGQKGRIIISLLHSDTDHIVLSIVDDGKGPPPNFNASHEGALGLQMVASLAQSQLGGSVEYFIPIEGGFGCRVNALPGIYDARV
ncbi:hypothetical protein MASR2M78_30690 [Treponema sp.]